MVVGGNRLQVHGHCLVHDGQQQHRALAVDAPGPAQPHDHQPLGGTHKLEIGELATVLLVGYGWTSILEKSEGS
jgi:hypothetical protein